MEEEHHSSNSLQLSSISPSFWAFVCLFVCLLRNPIHRDDDGDDTDERMIRRGPFNHSNHYYLNATPYLLILPFHQHPMLYLLHRMTHYLSSLSSSIVLLNAATYIFFFTFSLSIISILSNVHSN